MSSKKTDPVTSPTAAKDSTLRAKVPAPVSSPSAKPSPSAKDPSPLAKDTPSSTKTTSTSTTTAEKPPGAKTETGEPSTRSCQHDELFTKMFASVDPSWKVCPMCYAAGARFAVLKNTGSRLKAFPELLAGKAPIPTVDFQSGVEWTTSGLPKSKMTIEGFTEPILNKFVKFNPAWDYWLVKKKDGKAVNVEWGDVIVFPVEKGMNGETYHGLLAALLTNTVGSSNPFKEFLLLKKPPVKPEGGTVTHEDATPNQVAFLQYFLGGDQLIAGNPRVPRGSTYHKRRPLATQAIAEYFRINPGKHSEIFQAIRDYFNDGPMSRLIRHSYTTTAQVAMAYMEEYLAITGQMSLESVDPSHVVVIFVRSDHQAGDSRLMDTQNLLICLKATVLAFGNRKGLVILMGDIGYERLGDLKSGSGMKGNIDLVSISSPFYDTSKIKDPDERILQKIKALWTTFKNPYSEYIPTEVKFLGFYLALHERFGERLSIIGWRSGTLDGAGFLGIPIYWLDNIPTWDEERIGPKSKTIYRNGHYLWRLRHKHSDSDAVTEYYKRFYDLPTYQAAQKEGKLVAKTAVQLSQRSERMEELATVLDNFILINVNHLVDHPKELEGREVIRLGSDAHDHLWAALSVFAMTDTKDKHPLWTQRLKLMGTNELEDYFKGIGFYKPKKKPVVPPATPSKISTTTTKSTTGGGPPSGPGTSTKVLSGGPSSPSKGLPPTGLTSPTKASGGGAPPRLVNTTAKAPGGPPLGSGLLTGPTSPTKASGGGLPPRLVPTTTTKTPGGPPTPLLSKPSGVSPASPVKRGWGAPPTGTGSRLDRTWPELEGEKNT